VLMGLAGFYLIEDAIADAKLGLPTGSGCPSGPTPLTPTTEAAGPPAASEALPASTTQPSPSFQECDDIPIMFQQVPAEMLAGEEFQPVPFPQHGEASTPYRAVWTVNNTLAPSLTVTNKPYRFRFLNGNDELPLTIWTSNEADAPDSYPQDAYLQQVGTDGGLMNEIAVDPQPQRTKIRLFPAQRADVVIDFSSIRTPTTVYLQAQTGQAFVGGTAPSCVSTPCPFGDDVDQTPAPLIEFVVEPTASAPPEAFSPPGGTLRGPGLSAPIARLSTTSGDGTPVTERSLLFGFNGHVGRNPFATINGRFFDHKLASATPVIGTTEIWHLVNSTDGYHPVHIHDIEFQVTSRARCPDPGDLADLPSDPETPYSWCDTPRSEWTTIGPEPGDWASCPSGGSRCNLAWRDVFVIPPYSEVTIIGTFTDNLGTYVFHCHNLIHEDAGMMAQFEVIAEGETPSDHAMSGMQVD
jgi:spore coat protein A